MLIVISFSNDKTLSICATIGTKHKIMVRCNIVIQEHTLLHNLSLDKLVQHTNSRNENMELQPHYL